MNTVHRWSRIFIISFLCAILIGSVNAQGVTDEPITIDGVNHVISYPAEISLSKVQTVRRVLDNTLSRYSALFGITSPRIAVIFSTTLASDPTTLAAAGPRPADSPLPYDCFMYVYPHPSNNNPSIFRFTLAHELAHCFQFAVNPASIAAINSSGSDANLWWVEGSAEWLASLIYPPVGNPIAETIRSFYLIVNENPLTKDYENFWFFVFYARHFGESATMGLIRNIPNTEAEHIRYLEGVQATPDMMMAYGRLVQQRRLRRQPAYPPRDAGSISTPTLPYVADLALRPLSIAPMIVQIPPIAAGKGLKIAQTDGTAVGYRTLLADGTLITADGVTVCGEDVSTRMIFMVTRGNGATDAEGKLSISETTCGSGDCFVGEWVGLSTQRVGESQDNVMLEPSSYDDIKFTITADGTITGQVVGVQDIPNGFVNFNTPALVSGSFTVRGEPVQPFLGWQVIPISFNVPITGTVTSNGGIVDANDIWTFYDGGLTATIKFPAYQALECGNMTTTPDGQTIYNALAFYEGTAEQAIAYESYPVFELIRAGSF